MTTAGVGALDGVGLAVVGGGVAVPGVADKIGPVGSGATVAVGAVVGELDGLPPQAARRETTAKVVAIVLVWALIADLLLAAAHSVARGCDDPGVGAGHGMRRSLGGAPVRSECQMARWRFATGARPARSRPARSGCARRSGQSARRPLSSAR